MLEPEEFDDNALLEENSKIYFSRNDQDLEEMMKHHGLDSDEDAQIGLAKKVIDLTGNNLFRKINFPSLVITDVEKSYIFNHFRGWRCQKTFDCCRS